ncbi:MAG: chitobiase/beta-hexosaminidase C-terminal domain-containing protein [Bacteroidales bacterium]|nr:chitobiase/beta-hexosaminidase C-terminal domain-containing protein [Bacteroidales bacterium]
MLAECKWTPDGSESNEEGRDDSASGSGGSGNNNSGGSNSGTGTGSQTETVEAPVISGETSFTDSTEVTITGPSGAQIRYTTDGSTPTASSNLYSAGFNLSDSATVKAIAIKDGVSSSVASKVFTKQSSGGGQTAGGYDIG